MNQPLQLPFVSVIVPCFNESSVIEQTHKDLSRCFEGDWHKGYEIIYVNDGSSDTTLELLRLIAISDAHAKVISFSRHFGTQEAIFSGITNCRGDVAIIFNASLGHPPEMMAEMVRIYRYKKCNVVNTIFSQRNGDRSIRAVFSICYDILFRIFSGNRIYRGVSEFRLLDRKVITAMNQFPEKNKYLNGLISWMGFRQEFITGEYAARKNHRSRNNNGQSWKLLSILFFNYSRKPLQLATTLGICSLLAGLIILVVLAAQHLFNPGDMNKSWVYAMVLIIFFGGVQLLTIGVLGTYIGRIFEEVKNRPDYLVEEKINF